MEALSEQEKKFLHRIKEPKGKYYWWNPGVLVSLCLLGGYSYVKEHTTGFAFFIYDSTLFISIFSIMYSSYERKLFNSIIKKLDLEESK